jgi:hypothetical protein
MSDEKILPEMQIIVDRLQRQLGTNYIITLRVENPFSGIDLTVKSTPETR